MTNDSEIGFVQCAKTAEDAQLIMSWRNDFDTLSMSYHNSPLVWDTFWCDYVDNYFANKRALPLFAVCGDIKFGFIKFNEIKNPLGRPGLAVDVSINIDPQRRGIGLGKQALLALNAYLKENSEIACLLAEIKSENEKSKRAIEYANYVYFDTTRKYVADIDKYFEIFRFINVLEPNYNFEPEGMEVADAG